MKLVITGGAGFIGTNFVYHSVDAHPDYEIVVIDKLTYAGNRSNLEPLGGRIQLIEADICDAGKMAAAMRNADYTVHFAAESHNTRSESDPDLFYRTNVEGTRTLLDAAVRAGVKKFVHISTDEVYGDVREGVFCKETDKEAGDGHATSAYSKSKAQGDELAQQYSRQLPLNIVRPTNNFGPWQHPEKALPRSITRVLSHESIPLWGEGNQIRDWLFAPDNVRAIDLILHKGRPGEIYNVAANNTPEIRNRDWAHWLMGRLHRYGARIENQIDQRPMHDFRYGVDATKLQEELGWQRPSDVWEKFEVTVQWYLDREDWWKPLRPAAEEIYTPTSSTRSAETISSDLEQKVVQMLRSKTELPEDERYLLQDRNTIQSAIGYFAQYGDFSVTYYAGDTHEDPMRLGGNTNPLLLVEPPR